MFIFNKHFSSQGFDVISPLDLKSILKSDMKCQHGKNILCSPHTKEDNPRLSHSVFKFKKNAFYVQPGHTDFNCFCKKNNVIIWIRLIYFE